MHGLPLTFNVEIYVNVNVCVTPTPVTLFVDASVLAVVLTVVLTASVWTIGLVLGVASINAFPPDARRQVNLSLYFDLCLCASLSVPPVRGREDTKGDRDTGVKVQVDWRLGVLSCPFESSR